MSRSEIESQVVALTEWMNQHRFGKYRGTVDSVETGDDLGIISVKLPDVFGPDLVIERVLPCVPFAGSKHGLLALPEEGDGVWVEFEAGNPSSPVWTGFWWAEGEIPEPKGPLVRSFITSKGHKLVLNDDANEVQLLHAGGAEITLTDSEVTIRIGDSSITLGKSDITLKAGAVSPQPQIRIEASQIAIQAGTVGSVKLTSAGVDIGNGAMKIGT